MSNDSAYSIASIWPAQDCVTLPIVSPFFSLIFSFCFFFFMLSFFFFFFFQAEDGIRDGRVTGVQTCALPILRSSSCSSHPPRAVRLVFGQGKAECTAFPQSRLPVHSQIECAAADPAGRSTHPEPSRPERSGPWGLAACAVPLEALVLFPAFVSNENRPKSTGRPSDFRAHPPRGRFVSPEVHNWHRGVPVVRENRPGRA